MLAEPPTGVLLCICGVSAALGASDLTALDKLVGDLRSVESFTFPAELVDVGLQLSLSTPRKCKKVAKLTEIQCLARDLFG